MRAEDLDREVRALASAPGHVCFPLTEDLHGCRSVRLRSRFLLNSFWRQLRTHYKARTEALCESIEKSPIDVNGSKARGTFVAQFVGDRLAVQRSVIRKASPALASGQHLSLSDNEIYRQPT